MRLRKAQKAASRKPGSHVKLILVKWRDATHVNDDLDGTPQPKTMLAWTVGFQVHRTREEIALCMEIHEDSGKRDITTIPMGMVIGIKPLARIPIASE